MTAFSSCRCQNAPLSLRTFLRTEVISDRVEDATSQGSIALYSAIPGIVWQLAWTTNTKDIEFFTGSFGLNPFPVFSSWKDFAWVLARFFSKEGRAFSSFSVFFFISSILYSSTSQIYQVQDDRCRDY
jgi:hypothetical protein